jgi:hypothetical protein
MTIVVDCKTRVKKFKDWQKKRNVKKQSKLGKSSAKLFTGKKTNGKQILKSYSSLKSNGSKQSRKLKKQFVRRVEEPNDDLNNSFEHAEEPIVLRKSSSKMTNPYETKYDYETTPIKQEEDVNIYTFEDKEIEKLRMKPEENKEAENIEKDEPSIKQMAETKHNIEEEDKFDIELTPKI